MTSTLKYFVRSSLLFLTLFFVVVPSFAEGIRFVRSDAKTVRVGLPKLDGDVSLVAAGCFVQDVGEAAILYQGPALGQVVTMARHDDSGRDRLFDRFCLRDATGNALGMGRYANAGSTPQDQSLAWPDEIKGLQCVMDFDDAADLGAAHVTVNVPIASLLKGRSEVESTPNELIYVVDGYHYEFHARQVASLDRKFLAATSRGMNAIAILLCNRGNPKTQKHVLLHPDADSSVGKVFGVNLSTQEAERQYRAVIGFLGRRYSRKDKKFGSIGGYIVGNEVQSHSAWHNMGRKDSETVIQQYANQLRMTYLSLCSEVANPRVFVSFDHHWTSQQGNDHSMAIPGKRFLDRMAQRVRETGDFPWHVAWHPYPENLFDPVFWNDVQATYSLDTPKITFKNIEVLLAYLNRSELRYEGERRRVILSEQGFHAGDTLASEEVQAAAFAASYVRIRQLEGIDAYILHRHVDHPLEGGLKVGLWTEQEGHPDRKRLIHRIFKAAGTSRQADAFDFALPIVDLPSWSAFAPQDRIDGEGNSVMP